MMITMDRATRWQGVYARHRKDCGINDGRRCRCQPTYVAKVWDRRRGRRVTSRTFPTAQQARAWRADTAEAIAADRLRPATDISVGETVDRFLAAARDGTALNRQGRRYKPSAIRDYDGCLRLHVTPQAGGLGGHRLGELARSDLQALVDGMVARGASASRVRSVITAVRAMYRWARQRDLAATDPCGGLHLPAVDEAAHAPIPDPAQLTRLLDALPARDALAYALAGYATGRRAEIRALRWRDVDLEARTIRWGEDQTARKSPGARRTVPIIPPLLARLRGALIEQGRPAPAALVVPGARGGQFSAEALATRARKQWASRGMPPVGLHDCRHASASYLLAAGVNLKAVSVLMGHASITTTVDRYGHLLPGAEEEAGRLLSKFLTGRRGMAAQ